MATTLERSFLFAITACALVLGVDSLLSLVFQPHPSPGHRDQFLVSHGVFHAAVFVLSAAGVAIAFGLIRGHLPSKTTVAAVAVSYGLATVIAGPGLFILAGLLGAATWLILGSLIFGLGAGLADIALARHAHG